MSSNLNLKRINIRMKASIQKQTVVDINVPRTSWNDFFLFVRSPFSHSGFVKSQRNLDRTQGSARMEDGTSRRRRGSRGMGVLFVRVDYDRATSFAGSARIAWGGMGRRFGVGGDVRRVPDVGESRTEVAEGLLVGIVEVPGCCILLLNYISEVTFTCINVIHKAFSVMSSWKSYWNRMHSWWRIKTTSLSIDIQQ